jgi:membrane associated rhomboid family serine protease
MTAAPRTTCYRHPDRETGRSCTRCGRPACPECLRDASVGAHCVDCVKEAAPSTGERLQATLRGQSLLATKAIIAINVAAYVWISIADRRWDGLGSTSTHFALHGTQIHFQHELYRTFTYSFVHYGPFHILFNMLVLYQVGRVLEPGAGSARFSLLYVVSVFGGAAGAMIMTPHAYTGGASGGVVGVAVAATLVMQRRGIRFWDTGFGPLLLIVLLEGFIPGFGNVSFGGHLGGAIAGGLATEAMLQSRKVNQPVLGWLGAVFVGAAAFLICLAAAGS